LLDVRFTNDWVVSRTGWTAPDTVVAFRSGGPSNHEHADRNSVIFKAHGERLFHDPLKAGYDPKGVRWLLRQTEAHTAVLIDGRGHQYHDGREGTNSSWAQARITHHATGAGWMVATSDGTEAYQLVNDAVRRVERTVVFVKPDILLLFDRVSLDPAKAAAVQLRFQVNNEDGHGQSTAEGTAFRIRRPHASLLATVHSPAALTVRTGQLALPPEEGNYPFVEVAAPAAAEHEVLTACVASPTGEAEGEPLSLQRLREGSRVTGRHRGRAVDVTLAVTNGQLEVTVA
jgi:hypothetical protein